MKPENLQEAIGLVGDDLVASAGNRVTLKKPKYWLGAIAACLAAIIALGIMFIPERDKNGTVITPVSLTAYTIKKAEYPKTVAYPSDGSQNFFEEEKKWKQNRQEIEKDYDSTMTANAFFKNSFKSFLMDTEDKNKVYSPLNIYFTLGMLAELTDGNTRQEILNALAADNIETLRKNANAIWRANYFDDQRVSSILASSLWLNDKVNFKQETLSRIAENYYASSYKGEMGSKEFNGALISWLNSNTKNLLTDKTANIELPRETALAVASTIYFKAAWLDEFHKSATVKKTFYTNKGEIECDFMNASHRSTMYYGENFSAARLPLNGSGYMYFILPDKGTAVDEIVSGQDAANLITKGNSWENKKVGLIKYSIPKFDVSGELDLNTELKELGIKDAFNRFKADFTPTTEDEKLFLSKAEHVARVTIDEKGCTGAAYTVALVDGTSARPDEIMDFALDRPFIFAVTSVTGDVLFAGVVNNP